MSHEFELIHDVDLEATPEQVWEAIATGPGMDSWFMGRNEIEPHLGGKSTMTMPGFTGESTVTAWDPPRRFGFRADPADNGAFMAFEYLIEGRDGGSTSLRLVHSGVLAGDWEAQYDALRKGNPLYLRTLGQYLKHFPGRTAVPVTAFGPPQPDQQQAWDRIAGVLGLGGTVNVDDKVHFSAVGQEFSGVVDTVLMPGFIGIRTDDALLRFTGGGGMMLVSHHIFAEIDQAEAEQTWGAWLASVYA